MSPPDVVPLLTGWHTHEGPLHRSLAASLAALIDAHLLRPGDRLPSERTLARRLAVSRTTTAAAYDMLRQRGMVASIQGSGSTVAGPRGLRHDPAIATLASNPFIGDGRRDDTVIDLSVCRFDPPPLLVDALATGDELVDLIGAGHHTAGLPQLREAIAAHLSSSGLPTTPSQVLITTGSQQALSLIASDLERNDRVLIEDPTYFGTLHAYLHRRVRLLPIPFDELDRAASRTTDERRIDLIHVTSAVHNPTGRQLDTTTGHQLVDLARRCSATLVDDHALRYLADEHRPFLASHDPDADIITIGSFSKVLWSALRTGWMRAPAPTIARLTARKASLDLASPALDQALALHSLPYLEPLAVQRRERLQTARHYFRGRLVTEFPGWFDESHESGPFAWVRTDLDGVDGLIQTAAITGLRLTPGSSLSPTDRWNAYLRIAITANDETLETALFRLRQSVELYSRR